MQHSNILAKEKKKKKKALLDSSVAGYSIIDVAVAVSKSGGGGGGWWVLAESHEGVGEQHGSPAGGLREPPRQREPHRPPVLQRLLVPPANKKKIHNQGTTHQFDQQTIIRSIHASSTEPETKRTSPRA